MENRAPVPLSDQYSAALEWWREAGVDCDYLDDVQVMLADPEAQRAEREAKRKAAAAPLPPPEKAPAIAAQDMPDSIDAFRSWWCSPQFPIALPKGPRPAPRGRAGARLMLLAPMPEAGDTAEALGGPQGALLANICRALDIPAEAAYFATALPVHMPLPDWQMLSSEGLGRAIERHIALAHPERVLVLDNAIAPLLGHDRSAPPEQFSQIAGIPALTTFSPDRLLDHPRQRARLWQRLLEWTA